MCAVTLVLGSFDAYADTLDDQFGPREIALGDSLRADARGALSITLNPSGLAGARELAFEGSYGYRPADGTSSVSVSGCDSTVTVPGCFYYRYLTASPSFMDVEFERRVHEAGATFARTLTQQVLVGANIKYFDYNSDVEGEDSTSGLTVDVGATVKLANILSVGAVGYHLVGKESPHYRRSVGAGVSLRPIPKLGVSFDALWRLDRDEDTSTGRYGGGIEYFLQSSDKQTGYPLRLGAVHDVGKDATFMSGGVGFLASKVGLDIGLRRQVAGGDELVIQASLRVFGPRGIPGTRTYR